MSARFRAHIIGSGPGEMGEEAMVGEEGPLPVATTKESGLAPHVEEVEDGAAIGRQLPAIEAGQVQPG